MSLKNSILQDQRSGSLIASQSLIVPTSQHSKKPMDADLSLTSLVDVFSILVIYLLVLSMTNGEKTLDTKNITLPTASRLESLSDVSVVKYEQGQFTVDDKPVKEDQLVEELVKLRKNLSPEKAKLPTLILQADKETPYSKVNAVVLAAAISGFSSFKMAVMPKGT